MTSTNTSENKKPLVVYHANCMDGKGAAWCFWVYYKENVEYHAASYSDSVFPDFENRDVYILDFSYPVGKMEEILKVANKVVYIDHHAMAIQALEPLAGKYANFEAHCGLEESGAILTYDYLENNVLNIPTDISSYTSKYMRSVLQYIEDRDLWKWKLPKSREINAALSVKVRDFRDLDSLVNDAIFLLEDLEIDGDLILKVRKKIAQDIVIANVGNTMYIDGHLVVVAACPPEFASEVAEILYTEYPHSPFVATYHDTPHGRKVSLRSSKNSGMDVSLIAKNFNGGGHKHAAGFSLYKLEYSLFSSEFSCVKPTWVSSNMEKNEEKKDGE